MTPLPPKRGSGRRTRAVALRRATAVVVGVLAAVVFWLLCSVNLTGQGVYYDEVHQAPAAFVWLGREPFSFSAAVIHGVPLLNMSYSGALKSHLYGAYLRGSGWGFSIRSWRSLGIGLAAVGICAFAVLAGPCLPMPALLLFLLLLVSDGTVLLTSRHDWGPTALALALRLLFLAVWLRGVSAPSRINRAAWMLGAIAGLSIFEKLSSVVLLAPLYLQLLMRPWRTFRSWTSAHLGLLAGALPLIVANIYTWRAERRLISLLPAPPPRSLSWSAYASDYLSLGQGRAVMEWVFGSALTPPWYAQVETLLIAGICGLVLVMARRDVRLRAPAWCIAGYGLIGCGVKLLPATTYVHHWIIGTPFQYLGMALAWAALADGSPAARRLLVAALSGVILLRLPVLYAVERGLADGRSAARFDPSLTQMAEFAARHPESRFVATTWGTGVQMYCLSNGQPGHVIRRSNPSIWRSCGLWWHARTHRACISSPIPMRRTCIRS